MYIFHGILPSNTDSNVVNLRAYITDIVCVPFNVNVFILLQIFNIASYFSEEGGGNRMKKKTA